MITKSTSEPDKYAPKFCLKLKFNCKLRSSHPCCKYPLPPRNNPRESTTAEPQSGNIKVRPTRIQVTTNNARKSSFRRPLRRKPVRNIIEKENEITDEKKDSNDLSIKIENQKRKTIPIRSNGERPSFRLASKPSPNPQIRRPNYSTSYKSPVCRIINCRRNKKHNGKRKKVKKCS